MNRSSQAFVFALGLALPLGCAPGGGDRADPPVAAAEEAQVTAAEPEQQPVIEDQALALLERMAGRLAAAESLSFVAEMEFDAVQDSGQKLSFGSTNRVTARRPDRARVEIDRRDGSRHRVVIDGRQIALYTETDNVYATAAKSGSLEDSLDYLVAELEVPMPLSEVIRSDFPALVTEGATSVRHVTQSNIGGEPCHHLAVRNDEVDFQVWLARDGEPLPQRVVITYKHEPGEPQFRADFVDWDLEPETPDSLFVFEPPAGAEQIPFMPLSTGAKSEGDQ